MNLLSGSTRTQKIAAFLLVVAAVVGVFALAAVSPAVVAGAQILAAVGTLSLAVLGVAQIREMKESRLEQEKARLAQEKPQVIVDADYRRRGLVDIMIKNVGRGAAKDIRFEFSGSLPTRLGMFPGKDLADLREEPIFRDGLDYIAADAEIRMIWDGSAGFWQFLKEQGVDEGIRVTSSFKSLNDNPDSTTWIINPLRLSRIPEASKDIGNLVEVAEAFRKDFRKGQK